MDTKNLNTGVTNINSLGFSNIWSGSAYEVQSEQLTDTMSKLNQCIADISAFDAILLLKDIYIALCEKIAQLYSAMASCASGHTKEQNEEGCGTCGAYAAEIAKKEEERKQLREEIIALLGQFSGIDAEIAEPADLSVDVNPDALQDVDDLEDITKTGVLNEVPKYNQLDYTCKYGNVILKSNGQQATVRNSGCGITCLAMLASYVNDDPTLTPDVLAEKYGKYNTPEGSAWSLFTETAGELGLGEVKQVHDWGAGEVEQALRDGCLVISNQRGGKFTTGGHYILLTGISEDGKVYVNDPNGANWEKGTLVDGFENGFKYTDISYTSAAYWIYDPKGKKSEVEE